MKRRSNPTSRKILILGDGDFTFARALARHDGSLAIYATELGSADELRARYFDSDETKLAARLAEISSLGVTVALGVDATTLGSAASAATSPPWLQCNCELFDTAIFNFPHSYRHGGTAKMVKSCFSAVRRSGVLKKAGGRLEMRLRSLSPKEDARYGYVYESAARRGWHLEAVLPAALLATLARAGYAHTQTKRKCSALDALECRPLLWRWRRSAAADSPAYITIPRLIDAAFRDAAMLPLAADHRRVDAALHMPCPCIALRVESRRREAQAAAAAVRGGDGAAATGSSSGKRRRRRNGPIDELIDRERSAADGTPHCWCEVPSDLTDEALFAGVHSSATTSATPNLSAALEAVVAPRSVAALLVLIESNLSHGKEDEIARRLALWRLLKRTSMLGDAGATSNVWRALALHYRTFSPAGAHEPHALYCDKMQQKAHDLKGSQGGFD